jgi:hypothetical protein
MIVMMVFVFLSLHMNENHGLCETFFHFNNIVHKIFVGIYVKPS